MKQQGGFKRFALSGSILLMIAIYSSYLAIDIHTGFSESTYSRIVRYLGILICVVLVFVAGKDANNPRDLKLMKWAMFFTACADFVMSMICNFALFSFQSCSQFSSYRFPLGALLFIIVQLILINRHRRHFKWRPKEVVTGLIVFGLMIEKVLRDIKLITMGDAAFKPALIAVMGLYAAILCVSLWMAIGTLWRGYFPRQTAWIITIGMILFFLCDNSLARATLFADKVPIEKRAAFIIATNTIHTTTIQEDVDSIAVYTDEERANTVTIPYTPRSIAALLVWFFYLPAQVLLMLSVYNPDYLNSVFGAYPRLRGRTPPVIQKRGV